MQAKKLTQMVFLQSVTTNFVDKINQKQP